VCASVVALTILISACSGAGEVTPTTTEATTECGIYVLDFGVASPDLAAGYDCLIDAFQKGEPARLVVTNWTFEGDPIPQTFLVTGPESVVVITDARQDKLGSGRIERQTCTGVRRDGDGFLSLTGCQPA